MTAPVGLLAALHERYEVVREVGRGGMATVYLARDRRLDREVAIKVLYTEFAAALSADRFRREVQFATQLSHPHILPIHDFGESDGSLYYVMPYVRGESLRARMTRERQLPIEDALRIAVQVASALEHAHLHGVVHRDIKPENILLEEGYAVVADFGIARAIGVSAGSDTLTRTGMTLGTPYYMSPEQALADKMIDGRSDQYALACVLYEMLVGEAPFQGPNAQAIMARHSLAAVPSLKVVRGAIPDHVEAAITQAMAKVPADRFTSMSQFVEAISGVRAVTMRAAVPSRARVRSPVSIFGALIALAMFAGAWTYLSWSPRVALESSGAIEPTNLAVLYFSDRSPGGRLGYFADALTESLIGELRQVRGLHVVSRDGVAPFRDESVPLDSIARSLRVATLVQGSVEAIADRIRLNVRLIDAQSGSEFRSKGFDLPTGDLLAMRDSLSGEVAVFLREYLGDRIALTRSRRAARNPEAWVLVQRAERLRKEATALLHEDRPDDATRRFDEADSLLANAEALDAQWAEPSALRADLAFDRARMTGDALTMERLTEAGLRHAGRATQLDDRNPDALEIRGKLRYWKYLNHVEPDPHESAVLFADAEKDLRAAVAINPGQVGAWSALSHLNLQKPDFVGAKLAARRAYEEDAFFADASRIIERLYETSYVLEQFSDARHWCEVGATRFADDARFVRCQLWLMTARGVPADTAEAARLAERLLAMYPEHEREYHRRESQMVVAIVLGRADLVDSARRLLEVSRATPDVDPTGELLYIEAFARETIGDRDEAIRLLERYLSTNPEHREGWGRDSAWWWREIKTDPRFMALIGTTG